MTSFVYWIVLFFFFSGATAKCYYKESFITPIGEIILYYIFYGSSSFQITYAFSPGQALHEGWFVIIELDKRVFTLPVATHVDFFLPFVHYGFVFI